MGEVSEPSLERAVGRIEGTLAAIQQSLADHTKQDSDNFESLAAKIDALDLDQAVRRRVWKWMLGVPAAIVAVAEAARALGILP